MKLPSSNSSKNSTAVKLNGKNVKIAIILSRFNDVIGNELYKNCVETLQKHGLEQKNIHLTPVPGALETPLAAQLLAESKKYDAIIALGIVIRGDTYHFELVCNESYRGLMDTSLKTDTPIVFGIITANTEKQARDRASKSKLNKGKDFAEAALEMATLARLAKK